MKNYIHFENIYNSRRPISIRTSEDEYIFRKITSEELLKMRMTQIPGVAYKVDGKLFFTEVDPDLNVNVCVKNSKIGTHLCWENCNMLCKGCPRARDFTVAFHCRHDEAFETAVMKSWRIEKYQFITEGVEAFNMATGKDALYVVHCNMYKEAIEKKFPRRKVLKMKQSIRDFYKLLGE